MKTYKTQNPEVVFAHIRKLALAAYHRDDERRIGVRKLIEQTRADLKVQVNNSDLVLFSDRLRAEHPYLAPLIEVRGRGPRKAKNPNQRLVDFAHELADLSVIYPATMSLIMTALEGRLA